MDAVKFIKQINRLCEAQEDCKDCPLIGHACDVNTATIMSCYNIESVQKMVQIVEQWAKDHPVKTRQSEFLKQFPSAFTSESVLQIQPCLIDKDIKLKYHTCFFYSCDDCKRKFWLTPIDESEEK
jgi:hypothetical protein